MQERKGLVTIIVPVFRTGPIIAETIQSVLDQTHQEFEIIAIDDGSGDSTIDIVDAFADHRVRTFRQENQGMAATRNNGLALAQGEFIHFLDHDDLLAPDFLEARLAIFGQMPEVGFVGGPIQNFPSSDEVLLVAGEDVEQEILFSNRFSATPSSYLVRRKVLRTNGIRFNPVLSNGADRFFLLQLNRVTRGAISKHGVLYYRVLPNSFSRVITPELMMDAERLYVEIERDGLTPAKNASLFRHLYFYMLGGGFFKVGMYRRSVVYLSRSFLSHPPRFVFLALRKLSGWVSNRGTRSAE